MISPKEYCTTLGGGALLLVSVWAELANVEVEILDRAIPVRIEDFKAPLLFLL